MLTIKEVMTMPRTNMTAKRRNEYAVKRCKKQISSLAERYGEKLPGVFFHWLNVICQYPAWAFCHWDEAEKREWIDCFYHDVMC